MGDRIILDGGMGTMLQARGLKPGDHPEIYGMEHPEIVEEIHRKYIEAGSNVIYANTFEANGHKLKGTGHTPAEVITANIRTARRAAGDSVKVALDVGPIGELMEPLGTLTFEEAYQVYKEMVVAGEKAGADLVVFETQTDLQEVRAGVFAARENTDLPVWTTMSFEESGRTFSGTTVASMACTLDALGVDAMGVNCSLGPRQLIPIIEEMITWTDRPIIVKPNAGLPDPATGAYSIGPEEFAQQMRPYSELGVSIMGGCCGTDPEFIRNLSEVIPAPAERKGNKRHGVCAAGHMTELKGIRVIGERINPTGKKRFQQALREHDLDYIIERAIEQADAGADILDINVGLPGIDEPAMMREVVTAVQGMVSLPLQIDSSNIEAIEAGLRACNGRAIVNSVNGDEEKLKTILPIVHKYGAAVVGLTLDENGIPQTAEERVAIARRIIDAAVEIGIPKEDVLVDCLTLTISAQQEQAVETLKAIRQIHDRMGLHCVLGVSNISFGLPERIHVTENFLVQAMTCGLDLPIVNPNQKEIMDAIASFKALSGEDPSCENYIARFSQAEEAPKDPGIPSEMTIEKAILKGLKKETRELTRIQLETRPEMEVINEVLIPALDLVGEKYEKQEIFLPQLINSANAACEGFDLIKTEIAKRGGDSVSKGKIILATVQGDIHDIGKNIVKVVLENYGFQVMDLGKDVPPRTVVETAVREDIRLIGLSALMTTTVSAMKETIELLRQSGHECAVMVGGAVLTEDYAREIGADYYARDAKASADIAKEFFSK